MLLYYIYRITQLLLIMSSNIGKSNIKIKSIPLHSFSRNSSERLEKDGDVMIPLIGLGTYKFPKGSGLAEKAVLDALELGYRLIDTAFIYGGEQTEKEVGRALTTAMSNPNLSRKEIFITTKQWRAYHGYEETLKCLDLSLKRLKLDYVDLYLIHWPGPAYSTMARRKDVIEKDGAFAYAKDGHEAHNMQALRSETWRAMEDAVYSGKCRAIGVSNFTVRHLEALKSTARIWPPAVNQIELHPYNPQTELVDYCKEHNIVVQAYASLGGQDCGKKRWNVLGGRLVERSETLEIAKKHGKTPAQVLLKWSSQQGFVVIPKSTNVDHLKENFEAVAESWSLDDEDMTLLASINKSSAENGSSSVDNDTEEDEVINDQRRLCWVRDPLKMLDFD